jgi:predicted CopG family antitoxin
MKLKTIAISPGNYELLRNFGKTGMSFNDVISELIKTKVNAVTLDDIKKLRSEQRPGNRTQTVSSPANSDI